MSRPLVVPRLPGPGTLVLRPWGPADLPAVRSAAADPLIPLITSVPAGDDAGACRDWLDRQRQRALDRQGWSFAVARDGVAVGQIGLWPHPRDRGRASVGYWLTAPARGRGLAAVALDVLVGWATRAPGDPYDSGDPDGSGDPAHDGLPVERLELYVEPWNTASWRTAEQCGFRREGLMRSWETVGGTRRDMYMYSRLRCDVRP